MIEKPPIVELPKVRFKPTSSKIKGFSSCIQCEKDACERQRDADYHWAITEYRAEVLKEVGEQLESQALVGEFGICLNQDKWDKFLEALKSGTMPPNKEGE